jgi:hypothetical protein
VGGGLFVTTQSMWDSVAYIWGGVGARERGGWAGAVQKRKGRAAHEDGLRERKPQHVGQRGIQVGLRGCGEG